MVLIGFSCGSYLSFISSKVSRDVELYSDDVAALFGFNRSDKIYVNFLRLTPWPMDFIKFNAALMLRW